MENIYDITTDKYTKVQLSNFSGGSDSYWMSVNQKLQKKRERKRVLQDIFSFRNTSFHIYFDKLFY